MTSTASAAKASKTKKVATSTVSQAQLIQIRDITNRILTQYFPTLSKAPNILFVAMATWGLESSFKIWPNGINSMHFTGTNPANSSLMGTGYMYSAVIKNILDGSPTIQQRQNIDEGRFPHGLSACMGCYHVAGTPNNTQEFRLRKDVIDAFGLEVQPGESITALFPNNETGMERSIASGLIILERKYLTFIKRRTPDEAIKRAVAAYVGRLGVKDANGYTPENRVAQVYSGTNSSINRMLASIGTVSTSGPTTFASLNDNTLKGTSENNEVRVASKDTQADPASLPGC